MYEVDINYGVLLEPIGKFTCSIQHTESSTENVLG